MARIYRARPDWAHLLSEANGDRSREQVYLKQDAVPYEVGTVITPEYVTEGVGEDAVRVASGVYVRLTADILDGDDPVEPVVLATRTVATSAAAPGVVTARDSVVKSFELEPIEDVTAEQVKSALAARNIIVR